MDTNSLEKVIGTYFAAVTKQAFLWNGRIYYPMPLVVRPNVRRGFTCPTGCGGCCPTFSLVWLPSERAGPMARQEEHEFDMRRIWLAADNQADNTAHHCRHLNRIDARCGIHDYRPLSCDFELLRFIAFEDRWELTTRLFGRGWNFLRTDGERGALCEIVPTSPEWIEDVVRRLSRLKEWTDHFGLDTWLEEVISYVRSEAQEPLRLEGRREHAEVYA